ncbi:MAG: hypothetical protein GY829_04435 [Gammaproteobacteria bacterium]|nr:hypothetical protein [Gammaproteobacteria bacterium]MCP4881127.1 hypothetical protein [Gammaproteobacteria bacterium]
MPQAELKSLDGLPELTTRADVQLDSANVDDMTVEVIFTTGQRGKRSITDANGELITFYEELEISTSAIRTDRLNKGLQVIDNHDTSKGVAGSFGVTRAFEIVNGMVKGVAQFSKRAEDIFNDVKGGILKHFSLGYKVHRYQQVGEQDGLPVLRAVDWQPTELSIVPVSFETENGIRSESPTNSVEIEFLTQPNEEDSRAMPDEILNPEGGQQRSAPAAPVVAAPEINADAIRQEESKRMADILLVTRQAKMDDATAIEYFNAGHSVEQARTAAFDKLTAQDEQRAIPQAGSTPHMQTVDDGSEARQIRTEAVTDAILMRAHGEGEIAGKFKEMSDLARGMTGLTMSEMVREVIGDQAKGVHSKNELFKRAFNSSSDFPIALEAAVNKSLRASYEENEATYEPLGRRATVTDFKKKNIIQMGDMPDLKDLNEHGEFERSTLSESGESYSIATAGRILGITRKALINDDLGVFTMMSQWGASARRYQQDKVWGALLGWDFTKNKAQAYNMADGKNFWHVDHNNVVTGVGSALSLEALAEARKRGRQAKTKDGNRMNIDYTYIVVPPELETLANQLLVQVYTPNTAADTNQFRGRYQIIVEPRLSDTANGATQWYMFSGNARLPVFEYAFLAGEEELNIETRHGFDVDGMEIRARTDFGVGLVDPLGGLRNAGV